MRPTLIAVALCGAASFDGYNLPKELLLAGLCVALASRLEPGDALSFASWSLVAWSGVSAAFAINGWLAWRAAGLTLTGVLLFEAARRLDAPGRGDEPRPYLEALAAQLPHHPSAKSLRAACGR